MYLAAANTLPPSLEEATQLQLFGAGGGEGEGGGGDGGLGGGGEGGSGGGGGAGISRDVPLSTSRIAHDVPPSVLLYTKPVSWTATSLEPSADMVTPFHLTDGARAVHVLPLSKLTQMFPDWTVAAIVVPSLEEAMDVKTQLPAPLRRDHVEPLLALL